MFKEKLSQTKIIEVADISSSTWYKKKNPKDEDRRKFNQGRPKTTVSKANGGNIVSDTEVIAALKNLRAMPLFQNGGGYKKMAVYLQRHFGFHLNNKKVYRLCKESDLLLPKRNKKSQRRTPIAINRTVSRPFQLWELDIKYGYIHGEQRFFFVMAIIDVYLRYIVGFHIGLQCLGSDLVRTLKLAMERMNLPDSNSLVIRMDNGPQMTSNRMFKFAQDNSSQLLHELIPVQTPNKDAHIESFYSILELECFHVNLFQSYLEAYQITSEFIRAYQTERIHGSLKNRTPQECLELYRNGTLSGIKNIRL